MPAGLLHTVAELAWTPVKAEPPVKTPESAAAEPTLITGVVPVFVVVTPSKLHVANVSTNGTGAIALAERLGQTVTAIATHANKAAAIRKTYLDLETRWGSEAGITIFLSLVTKFGLLRIVLG